MTTRAVTHTPGITGLTVYAYPGSAGSDLDDWTSNRVALTEGTGSNTGRYDGSLDDATDTLWHVFHGSSQPASWAQAVATIDLSEVNILEDTATIPAAIAALQDDFDSLVISGSVNDASATTSSFVGNSGLSSTNDFYNGSSLTFTSGALAGLTRRIDDYAGSTRTFTFSTAWPTAPANSVTFNIIGRIQ